MRSNCNAWPVLIAAASIAYPFLVWFALPHLPSRLLILPALALIALRATDMAEPAMAGICLTAGMMLLVLAMLAPGAAVRAYPVAMSLTAASAFGLSLIRGPSLVERLARRTTPDLPPEVVRYTRRVTLVWSVFLAVNAAIATTVAIFGTMTQWTMWNGLLFYLAAGLLFGIEYTVRRTRISAR